MIAKYHALSLVNDGGYDVDLIGWGGTNPCEEVMKSERIRMTRIGQEFVVPQWANWSFISRAIFKTLVQWYILFSILMFKIPCPTFILCQNPPTIPLLMVALLVSKLRRGIRGGVVIDWHNYGFTWLAVNRPSSHFLVFLHKLIEKGLGPLAHAHLCVSHAMQNDLAKNWGISASVLHDRPQPFFKRSSISEIHDLMSRHDFGKASYDQKIDSKSSSNYSITSTAFTSMISSSSSGSSQISLRQDRPALLVSSTSWTADEDFGLLLEAVSMCDKRAQLMANGLNFPKVHFVVTGKGDLLEYYRKKIEVMELKFFKFFVGVFLSYSDYACLLGSADLGVSMHFSSSSLDLPMKVVDMFGSELPVLAYDYLCLKELVKDGINGFTFNSSSQLSNLLFSTLSKFPNDTSQLESFRHEIQSFKRHTWKQAWIESALPIFSSIHPHPSLSPSSHSPHDQSHPSQPSTNSSSSSTGNKDHKPSSSSSRTSSKSPPRRPSSPQGSHSSESRNRRSQKSNR